MFPVVLVLAGLGALAASGPVSGVQHGDCQFNTLQTAHQGSPNSFQQIVLPKKIPANSSENPEIEYEQVSYNIPIDEKLYTVHLKPRYFLADNFMVYLYKQESVSSYSPNIQTHCYYQGYIEGYPNSVVSLSVCSGLRGILQFENVSYRIRPLEPTGGFQHLLYKLRNENNESAVHPENNCSLEQSPMDNGIFISEKSESATQNLIPLYLEMHIVVDKVLYDYLGSDSMKVTNKIIEIIGLVNSMFAQLKLTVVLTSLELWSDKNKISTVGEADELLHRFSEWKKSYLTLRPHDIAYLFISRDHQEYMGATFPGKMCVAHYSAGIVLYPKEITLEAFSVIVTQMLGHSLGISYDDPKRCECSGAICIMNPEAMKFSGVKTFSSCSLSDFEIFISNTGSKCLQNKPQMQRPPASICGNRKMEGNETCDCGTEEQCGPDSCCNPRTCELKPGAQCDTGSCCKNCQIERAGVECRPIKHVECDVPEACNGTSPLCQPDITIHNGHICKNEFMCFDGDCHDLDARCKATFGKGSKNAPVACYEEMHSQADKFGNCGEERGKYKFCAWRNLLCGRLICTYPFETPLHQENGTVIYAYVRNTRCITADYRLPDSSEDPLVIRSGSRCDTGRICINGVCEEASGLQSQASRCSLKCHGHGVCKSNMECHCTGGYLPPHCKHRSREVSRLSKKQGLIIEKALGKTEKNWRLLCLYTALHALLVAAVVTIIAVL